MYVCVANSAAMGKLAAKAKLKKLSLKDSKSVYGKKSKTYALFKTKLLQWT